MRFRLPHPLVLLLGGVVVAVVLTWILPAGSYQRRTDAETGREVVIPGTYARLESTPVGPMGALLMIEVLEYRNYRVFVGTYPNDQPTIDEVERMVKRYPQLQRVEVPHPGPTSKADCLNAVVAAIFDYEREQGGEFAGVVLHDSEDVLHPLELKFFNYLLPRKDMI
ncbi:MAG: glycosyltransferase, partial [Rhizobacter sp.]